MNIQRLLIVSVSAGAGHKRAAEALRKQAAIDYPHVEVEHIDLVNYISFPTKAAFFDSYELMVRQLPELWGKVYKAIDNESRRRFFDAATSLFHSLDTKKFLHAVKERNPDHIICTHFTPSDVLSRSADTTIQTIPQSIVVTDYYAHELWVTSLKHTFFVATEKMKKHLIERGVPKTHIIVSGIPIDPAFYRNINNTQLSETMGIDPNHDVILVLAGGQGLISIEATVQALFATTKPKTIIAVAGNNKTLYKKLQSLTPPNHITYIPLGWTNDMCDYMQLANVIISKAGGITTSECIALGKPLIVQSIIPGQEAANVQYVESHGYGLACTDFSLLPSAIKQAKLLPLKKEKRIATKTILSTLLK